MPCERVLLPCTFQSITSFASYSAKSVAGLTWICQDLMESHKWAAFQYCSYVQADKGMLFERCTAIDGKWTRYAPNLIVE
jgi:hypothetical protein